MPAFSFVVLRWVKGDKMKAMPFQSDFLFNLIMRYYTSVKLSFVISGPKNISFSFR